MYILIDFPQVQDFQEYEGFEEVAHPDLNIDGAAYVPVEWLMLVMPKVEFSKLIEERIKSSMSFDQKDKEYVEQEWDSAIPFEGKMSVMEALIHISNT